MDTQRLEIDHDPGEDVITVSGDGGWILSAMMTAADVALIRPVKREKGAGTRQEPVMVKRSTRVWVKDHTAGAFGHHIVMIVAKDGDQVMERAGFCDRCYRKVSSPAQAKDFDRCMARGEPERNIELRRQALIAEFGDISHLLTTSPPVAVSEQSVATPELLAG